jgi:hypothetical protein
MARAWLLTWTHFDELVVSLHAVGEAIDDGRQLVVLLGSLPSEYDILVSIGENTKGVSLIEVKEKLLKEHEKLQKHEATEREFKARVQTHGAKRANGSGRRGKGAHGKNGGFNGKCFGCDQEGHMKRDCPNATTSGRDGVVFSAWTSTTGEGWLIDSSASSHTMPNRSDLFEYQALSQSIDVTIADGKKLQAVGGGPRVCTHGGRDRLGHSDG